MQYFEHAASESSLRRGLDQAVRNRAGCGPDGVTVAEFALRADVELARLRTELLTGAYRPRPARQMKIPKPGGGHRCIAVSCVRDRVVQHAFAITLGQELDGVLHDRAYAYRKGRSTHDALAAVERSLRDGLGWVLRADVESFFDTIPQALLLGELERVTEDALLIDLVGLLLEAGALVGGEIADPGVGTPQGSPLSPFLANLYLAPLDACVADAGHAMVRYGDDLCVNVPTRARAEAALSLIEQVLQRLRLSLNKNKLEVRHVGEGFVFLGFQFHPGGRRPGSKAASRLVHNLDKVLTERPVDGVEEIDEILHGWLGYYGSFAGIELPDAVRARAELLEEHRAEAVQLGPLGKTARSVAESGGMATSVGRSVAEGGAAAVLGCEGAEPAAEVSVWQEAATVLAGVSGTAEEDAARASWRDRLGIDDLPTFSLLAERLVAFDGAGVAEVLARLGRFGDAEQAQGLRRPVSLDPGDGQARMRRVEPIDGRDTEERPRMDVQPGDAERMLELFGGAEHVFQRDLRMGDRIERERVLSAPTAAHVRQHLAGEYWLGFYPLRSNNTVRLGAMRVLVAAKARASTEASGIRPEVTEQARRLIEVLRGFGIDPVVSREPQRGYLLWVLVDAPMTAARARTFMQLVAERAGHPGPMVTREVVPAQEVAKRDKPGTAFQLPLGLDPRTNERAWLCDDAFVPILDPCARLRALQLNASQGVAEALGVVRRSWPPVRGPQREPGRPSATDPEAKAAPPVAAGVDASVVAEAPTEVQVATSPLREWPRAQSLYVGCAVVRTFVDRCMAGQGMTTSERMVVADLLLRLGDEGVPALEGVLRYVDGYRPGLAERYRGRSYPYPISCGKVRMKWPDLTSRVGCDCRFRVPPGAYPTPVLHAVGAAEVPGLDERVREAASRGGLARAAMAAMNEGRKELGAKAAALCNRLSELRRQRRLIEKAIADVEQELDGVITEAGEDALETPAGTLRRTEQDGVRRFVLEV